MSGPRRYLPPIEETPQQQNPMVLPTFRPIAVYYRQSSMKQVGNISTDIQQVDLPNYVMTLGWQQKDIILIDEDEGVSGAKAINERVGMKRLYELVLAQKISAVAVQAEDRLFRDETQIQVNVFIDACVKNNVRVITPYFKYNFADEHEGPYHRLLFRMRAEQAADFLNSFVRGRLYGAKKRMILQGMWMGGNINLGFMVDDRKSLPDGSPNPDWRKYVPFPPCADVVVSIFETFVMLGGNKRGTLTYLNEHGPHFPDLDDPALLKEVPPGFLWDKPIRMEKRRNIFMVGPTALQNMLTNAVYVGHWAFKKRIVQWENHAPIVPEDLFFRAFNFLSAYNLDGTPNDDYSPRVRYRRSKSNEERDAYQPVYIGLLGSYVDDVWRTATAHWTATLDSFAYKLSYRDDMQQLQYVWSRRCDYFDESLNELLLGKLRATFDRELWDTVLGTAAEDFRRERKTLQTQLTGLDKRIENLLNNMTYVDSKSMLAGMQGKFDQLEQEKKQLQRKLEKLEGQIKEQDALIDLAKQADNVLQRWEDMGNLEKRAVAQAFIERVVVTPVAKHSALRAEIHWRDESFDTVEVPYRSEKWQIWTAEEMELLTTHLSAEATQLQIASSFPLRRWRSIRMKVYEILGKRSFKISPKPIKDNETYEDYLERTKEQLEVENPMAGLRWTEEEKEALAKVIERENGGATQLEVAAAVPYRSWEAIRKKIRTYHGKGIIIQETGFLEPSETFLDYLRTHPEAADSMSFVAAVNLKLRKAS